MRAVLALSVALLLSLPIAARAADGSAPVIELYTMGPGETLPERFGHAALCVRYPDGRRASRCYDYGAFDASDLLSLGFRFLRGESVFFVAVRDPESMIRDYMARDRTVWRQTLPLTADQARAAAAIVEEDAKPENREYHYHHYFDNCATRVRDIVDEVTGGALSSLDDDDLDVRTYRDFTREGLAEFSALLVATELTLGRAVDAQPDAYARMFLPEHLRDGVEKAIGASADLVHSREAAPIPSDRRSPSPIFPMLGLALFAGIAVTSVWGRFERLAIGFAAAPLALVGLILWAVAVISPLPEVRWNELLLVFVPLDAALPFLSERRRYQYTTARLAGVVLASALWIAGVFVQPLLSPLMLAMLPLAAIASARGWKEWLASRRATAASSG